MMKRKPAVILLLSLTALFLVAAGCGGDDNSSTGPSSRTLSDQEAYQQISENFDEVGLSAIAVAITQATVNWDGYIEPDIDDYLGGFWKASNPDDTVWYEYRNGWHIFYADSNATEYHQGSIWDFDFVVCDSAQLKVDGVILPFPEEPTYLDERAHVDVEFTMSNDTSSLSIGLLAYAKVVLELMAADYLNVNLNEIFTFTTEAVGGDDGDLAASFTYQISSIDLVLSPVDEYTCPTSGTVQVAVSVRVTNATETATASGSIDVAISGGDATVTITVGDFSDSYVYENICQNEWDGVSYGSIAESAIR